MAELGGLGKRQPTAFVPAVGVSQHSFDLKQASSNPSFQALGSKSRTNSFSYDLSRNSRGMSYAVSENCSSQTNLIFHLYLNADMHKLGTHKAQKVYVISQIYRQQ